MRLTLQALPEHIAHGKCYSLVPRFLHTCLTPPSSNPCCGPRLTHAWPCSHLSLLQRGYIISYEGAQKVLSNAKPIITQIDALFSLIASYEDFKFFWLSTDIAVAPHWLDLFLKSKVQDNCLKCYLPSGHLVYIGMIIFAVVSIVFVVVVCLATFGPLRGWAARLRGDKPPEDR
jgi:hypothetical protein